MDDTKPTLKGQRNQILVGKEGMKEWTNARLRGWSAHVEEDKLEGV